MFLGRVYAESSVPDEVLESARIDGASEARIFFTIVLRLLAPAMVTIFLFIFVATWNNFLLPLMMLNSPDLKPVTLGLYGIMSYFNPQYGPPGCPARGDPAHRPFPGPPEAVAVWPCGQRRQGLTTVIHPRRNLAEP